MLCNLENSKDLLRIQDIADETVAEETQPETQDIQRNFDEVAIFEIPYLQLKY